MQISINHQPSEWRCVWLKPSHPNRLFSQIQIWEWQRIHNEDDFLDPESYADMIECEEIDRYQQDET